MRHATWHIPDLVRAANVHYAVMHFAVVIVVRSCSGSAQLYLLLRRTIVAATAAGLLVQLLIPVLPPRMLQGVVDSGQLLGPSVYGSPSADHLPTSLPPFGDHYEPDAIVGSALVLAAFTGARLRAARHGSEPGHGGRPVALAWPRPGAWRSGVPAPSTATPSLTARVVPAGRSAADAGRVTG